MQAFGYVRISKLDERTTSPARQRQEIERLCASRGWELSKTFEDLDVSGYNGKRRPGLERMLSRMDEVDAIVFWKLDRLARGVSKFYEILQRAEASNVALV
ncbi:MAG TPA: recombinase family protein, partial [Actinomycetota bacterium]